MVGKMKKIFQSSDFSRCANSIHFFLKLEISSFFFFLSVYFVSLRMLKVGIQIKKTRRERKKKAYYHNLFRL